MITDDTYKSRKEFLPNNMIFREEYIRQAYFMTLLGATNPQLADYFEISISTLELWVSKYPDFYQALRKGRTGADVKAAKALLRRAIGFDYVETKTVSGVNAKGEKYEYTRTDRKRALPDVVALKFWLTNRQKANWSNTYKAENAQDDTPLPLENLTPEQKQFIRDIALKTITSIQGVSQN